MPALFRTRLLLLAGLLLGVFAAQAQSPFSLTLLGDPDTLEHDPVFSRGLNDGYLVGARNSATFFTPETSILYLMDTAGVQVDEHRSDGFFDSQVLAVHSGGGDDAYYAAGETDLSPSGGGGLGWVSRSDSIGFRLWVRTYEDAPIGALTDIGAWTLVAATREFDKTRVYWIDKATGDTTRSRHYTGGTKFEAGAIHGRADEGLALFTARIAGPGSPQAMCATRIAYDGDTLWQRNFSKEDGTELSDGLATADGGFFLTGACINGPDQGIHAVKTDSSGNVLFDKLYFYGDAYHIPLAATEMADGGFTLLTTQGSFDGIRYLVRLDAAGDTLWTRIWHDENGFPTDLMATADGLALTGEIEVPTTGFMDGQVFLALTDFDGTNPSCVGDCVWPGDADYDGDADIFDLLPIGVAFGETGPARPGATLDWEAQYAPDWTDTIPGGTNLKHVDTDGNETINDDDTLALHLNYGLSHPLRLSGRADGDLPLFLAFDEDSALAGDTVHLRVFLGLDTMLATDVLGVALEIAHDPGLIDTVLGMSFDGSWLLTATGDILTMARRAGLGRADLGQTRTNGVAVTGFGQIASVKYVLDDDLGGRGLDWTSTAFEIVDARIVDANGFDIAFNPISTALTVGFQATGIGTPSLGSSPLHAYPNPATAFATVDIPEQGQLQLFDAMGRELGAWTVFAGRRTLNLESLPAGTYLLRWTGAQQARTVLLLRH